MRTWSVKVKPRAFRAARRAWASACSIAFHCAKSQSEQSHISSPPLRIYMVRARSRDGRTAFNSMAYLDTSNVPMRQDSENSVLVDNPRGNMWHLTCRLVLHDACNPVFTMEWYVLRTCSIYVPRCCVSGHLPRNMSM